jgi:hypothetical protein
MKAECGDRSLPDLSEAVKPSMQKPPNASTAAATACG